VVGDDGPDDAVGPYDADGPYEATGSPVADGSDVEEGSDVAEGPYEASGCSEGDGADSSLAEEGYVLGAPPWLSGVPYLPACDPLVLSQSPFPPD
jgi:hypothetical protein